jgi:hypothetical protein
MAITTYADLQSRIASPVQRIFVSKAALAQTTNMQCNSYWAVADDAGATPSTPVVPTSETVGALRYPYLKNSSGLQRIGRIAGSSGGTALWWLCDRRSHQGGLSGTATGAQTTNLATAALTRGDTTGADVMALLEIYSQIGATGTTVSATYTNQAGTGSRTTPLVTWGGTGWREVSRAVLLPLQAGDSGVRSVESVTNTATTGTAGNFGVTLFKPLLSFAQPEAPGAHLQIHAALSALNADEVIDDACLFWLALGNNPGPMAWEIAVIED